MTVGKCLTKKICIVNEGRSTVKFSIIVIECSSEDIPNAKFLDKKEQNGNKHHSLSLSKTAPDSKESLDFTEFISVSPNIPKQLKPSKELDVTIKFKAIRRVKSLKMNLGVEVDSSLFPLLIVKGTCRKSSFYLNRTYISFGTIYEGCTAEEKLVLVNNGDIGSR